MIRRRLQKDRGTCKRESTSYAPASGVKTQQSLALTSVPSGVLGARLDVSWHVRTRGTGPATTAKEGEDL